MSYDKEMANALMRTPDNMITLSIIRLDHSIAEIKTMSPGIDIETLSREIFERLTCRPASKDSATSSWNSFARRNKYSFGLQQKLVKSILRYRKEEDRWTALSSVLLKSLAFHRHINPNMSASIDILDQKLPVVELPRTKYNRPFLPQLVSEETYTRITGDQVEESQDSAMNLSHQYPYICMVQKQVDDHSSAQLQNHLIGCDLINFELPCFSPTVKDFLKSFVGCFTTPEWKAINNDSQSTPHNDDKLLKEFYLRWSMKEAYTKALGLGMNIDFDSFETRLIGFDTDSSDNGGLWNSHDGIWNSIISNMQDIDCVDQIGRQFSCVGQVSRTRGSKREGEYWVFTFIPLGEEKTVDKSQPPNAGCICICEGPWNDEADATTASKSKDRIILENMTLTELIQSHGMEITG